MNQIFGITGQKKHGKDTLAKMVKEIDPAFTILHFADTLKHLSMRIFGLTQEQVTEEVAKETPFPEPVDMDDYLAIMEQETGLVLGCRSKIANTPRQILQYFGTDYVRAVKDSYWIDCLRADIEKAGGKKILIPDYRFPNEAEFLRSIGATLVKVVRSDMPPSQDGHASETSIESLPHDVVARVITGEAGLASLKELASALASGTVETRIRETREATSALANLVGLFNYQYQMWEVASGMGANIGVKYIPETGKKEWYIMDVSPELAKRPEASVLATVGKMLEDATTSEAFHNLLKEKHAEPDGPRSPESIAHNVP